MRDDAFDCVTFCETVLAAAIAHDLGDLDATLRTIRYHNGVVAWRERNHYFFEWSQHNVENKTCRPVAMDGSVELQKSVYWHREPRPRQFPLMTVIHALYALANTAPACETAISSASSRGGRTWIISTSASSPRRRRRTAAAVTRVAKPVSRARRAPDRFRTGKSRALRHAAAAGTAGRRRRGQKSYLIKPRRPCPSASLPRCSRPSAAW